MTAPRRLPLPGGAASFWDWTAWLCSRPAPPQACCHPRPSPHYTAHQPRGPCGRSSAFGLVPSSPCPRTRALQDKANPT